MINKTVDAAFLQDLQAFASKNTTFRLFLNDIDLIHPTRANIEKIFRILSNAILEPQLTLHVADIFKSNILAILSGLVHSKNIPKIYENHVRICLTLSKLLNLYPDVHSLAIDYFEKWPAPFVKLQLDGPPICKKSKIHVNNEILICEVEIATISYIFLKSFPSYFRNKWPWSEFVSRYITSTDSMIQWICCQCIGIITAMTPCALYMFTTKVLPRNKIDECSINFETNFNAKAVQDISSIDIPTYLNENELLSECTSIVSIGGINVPVYDANIKPRIKIVEVESTIINSRKIAMGILSSKAINLLGPVGSGKSMLVEYVAEKTGRVLGEDFVKVQLGDQTDSKMLLGTYRCTDIPGEFVWQPGVLTQAVINGSWLLLEDIDLASNDIASVLCSLLENKQLSVPGYRDSVPIKPGFQLFVTQRLMSSITGYHKRRNHACDFLTKHMLSISIDPLSYNELEKVITTLFPKLQTISSRIVSVFEVFTRSTEENRNRVGRLVSTRDLFKWCSRAIVNYDVSSTTSALKILQDAIDIFCCNHSDKDDRLNLAKVISSHLGIISENAIYFCTQYKPHLSLTPDALKAGRAVVKRINNVRKLNAKFCFTRPSACLLESIMCCIDAKEPVLLVGETGTGKTSTVQFLARSLGQELIVINMNQQSDSADLLGGFKPVDLKFIVAPIKKEFENVFCSYFNVEQNKTFLSHIAYCFNSHLYNQLVLLMKKSYEAAMRRLTIQEMRSGVGKKRKSDYDPKSISSQREFLEKWESFGKKLEKLEQQLKHRNALAFTFIEGSLVKAIENGYWVLLDEINLANAETLECLSSLLEGPHGSLSLLERGDKKPIKRHTNFTLFACMNPSTDIGKKDLSSGLRNRFTEFFVDELT
ncbi:AAA protein, partial [Oryctes borbonicus]